MLKKEKDLQQQLDQLKAENEELKKISKLMEQEFDVEICRDLIDNEVSVRSLKLIELQEQLKNLKESRALAWKLTGSHLEELLKLKQTLAEIKVITEDTIDMFYEGLETGGTYDKVETILQKISEVEDE